MFISSNFSWRDLSGLHLAGCFSEQWETESGKRVFLSHASQGRSKKLWALVASKTDLGHHQCLVFSFSVPLPVRRLTVNLSSRKIPGLNVYAQMQNEKEQEMKSPANPTEASAGSQRDLVHSLEILDTEFNSRPIGEYVPSSPESSCAARLVILCCHAIACLIATHPVPLFLFLRSEKAVAAEGRTRARKEQCNNTLFFFCRAFTVLDLRVVTANKERSGFSWAPSNKSSHFHVAIRSAFILHVETSVFSHSFRVRVWVPHRQHIEWMSMWPRRCLLKLTL